MRAIPCVLMRGGTSRGPFFHAADLPREIADRDEALLRIMGSGHELEIDGIGGGNPLTSKVAIIDRASDADADVNYLFAQVGVLSRIVDTGPNCGNMLVAVGPFAIETGIVPAGSPETTVRIRNINTQNIIEAIIMTPGGVVRYEGDTAIDGVPGSAAPIRLTFRDAAGSKTGSLFPTGHRAEVIAGIQVSCIDMSVPLVIIPAASLSKAGNETPGELDCDSTLLARIEEIRLEAGRRMGLGDVGGKVLPKVALISAARNGGTITSRYFVPTSCHKSHAITGGICLGAATVIAGTVAFVPPKDGDDEDKRVCVIEHPLGRMQIELLLDRNSETVVRQSSLVRTARKLFSGVVHLP